ncbi:hypothetical protein CBR_g37968 [Chara braunii]|uniref:Right handed beta helix domain-containing protein n=1 Tax=Chara braunii TaxID=69332 RepID=A0A388LPF3_CHABU|nr:hypothetical protein CBR_g37968 [Chara braunii]|eukprot:GBG84093.1 hypothetical protein CBR_g37968 [Chara braunii]
MAMAAGCHGSGRALCSRRRAARPTAMAAVLVTAATAMVVAVSLLPGVHGYGVKEFLSAYTNPSVSRIEVKGDVTLDRDLPELTRALTIVGVGSKRPVIHGRGKYSGIVAQADLTVSNVEFRSLVTRRVEGGGAITASGDKLVLDNCVFRGNRARRSEDPDSGSGGALNIAGPFFTISRCHFMGNRADGNGGAIRTLSDTAGSLTSCKFASNVAGNRGGAVALRPGTVHVDSCSFEGNKAGGEGAGALSCSEASCIVSNNVFKNNVATYKSGLGGAIRFYTEDEGSPALCKGNSFSGNRANGNRKSDNLFILLAEGETGLFEICDSKPPPRTLIDNEAATSVKYNACGRC